MKRYVRGAGVPLPPRSVAEWWGGVRGGGAASSMKDSIPPTPDPSPPLARARGGRGAERPCAPHTINNKRWSTMCCAFWQNETSAAAGQADIAGLSEPSRYSRSPRAGDDLLHDVSHNVFADLLPHVGPDAGRETIMEAGPDASVCGLFGKGRHAGPTMGDAGSRWACCRDLGDVRGSKRGLDDAHNGSAQDAVRARIFRVHRRRRDRLTGCLTLCRRVAIDVAITNRGDRPPEIVMIFGVQHRDKCVIEAKRHERHETGAVDDVHLLGGDELAYEGVIGGRRAGEPEPRRFG